MSMQQIKIGDVARDVITGFTGVVVARSQWLNNCDRLQLQPREAKDGKPVAATSFDEPNLEFVESTDLRVIPPNLPADPTRIRDVVRDRVTGLSGVVVGVTTWMNGCRRITVQPKELKDGQPVEPSTIDEPDLERLERPSNVPPQPDTGGPRPEPRRR